MSYNGYYVSFPRMRQESDSPHPHHNYYFYEKRFEKNVAGGKRGDCFDDARGGGGVGTTRDNDSDDFECGDGDEDVVGGYWGI